MEIGLRVKSTGVLGKQKTHILQSGTGVLVETPTTKNSLLVCVRKGDKGKFWAFQQCGPDAPSDDVEGASAAEEQMAASDVEEGEACEDSASDAEEQPQHIVVEVKDTVAFLHFRGLRGYAEPMRGGKFRVSFPCGAPSKAFRADQLLELSPEASLRCRLTAGVRVWLQRVSGMPEWARGYLSGQKRHRAVVRCLGWNDYYKKFVFPGRRVGGERENRASITASTAYAGPVRCIPRRHVRGVTDFPRSSLLMRSTATPSCWISSRLVLWSSLRRRRPLTRTLTQILREESLAQALLIPRQTLRQMRNDLPVVVSPSA